MQVEPFQRSLTDLNVDVMINGRRRDHGFERAHLEVSPVECVWSGVKCACVWCCVVLEAFCMLCAAAQLGLPSAVMWTCPCRLSCPALAQP